VGPLANDVTSVPWYHTIELPGGVVTPGYFDLRKAVRHVPIPSSLTGKRCLDAASSDGFWAFEMERRGAAEVVAFDIDDTRREDWQGGGDEDTDRVGVGRARRAFDIASHALGSRVQRHTLSVYDVTPDLLGEFDFVFMGSVLLHLRDPVRALSAIRHVVRGQLLSCEAIHFLLSVVSPFRPVAQFWPADESRWWTPNIVTHKRWLRAAGLDIIASGGPFYQRFGRGFPATPLTRRYTVFGYYQLLFNRPWGAPTHWILAAPDRRLNQ
jgi:tRNA (mo5U34)-methyltransferase